MSERAQLPARMIRPAALADITEIARLGALFHEQAQWSDVFEYSVDDCAVSLTRFMASDAFLCFVAEDEGQLVGMVAGIVSPVYFNHAHVSGEELFWWADPTRTRSGIGMRLLKALEEAAKAKGCESWQMKSIDRVNPEQMDRLYQRCGYRRSEHSYIKRL